MAGKIYPDKETILNLLKLGAILTTAFLAPGAIRMFKNKTDYNSWRKFHGPLLRRNIKNLKRKGLVEFRQENGQTVVKITSEGKTELLKFDLDRLEIKRMKTWDRQWRIVIFDIPNDKRELREIFREKLKNMGFYQFQESVFIIPFPCEQEIQYLREIYEIPNEVKLILAKRVENDSDLRRIYRLEDKT